MSATRQFAMCLLLLCGVLAGCSDATAPEGAFLVVVSPDTVPLAQGGGMQPFFTFRERFVSLGGKVWVASPDMETEVTPGQWRLLNGTPDSLYLQTPLGSMTSPTNSDLGAPRTIYFFVPPGRYRLRQRYQVTASNATQGTGEVFVATSNVFVVVP